MIAQHPCGRRRGGGCRALRVRRPGPWEARDIRHRQIVDGPLILFQLHKLADAAGLSHSHSIGGPLEVVEGPGRLMHAHTVDGPLEVTETPAEPEAMRRSRRAVKR